jgi:L-histidine N-alpha-methyltransferase
MLIDVFDLEPEAADEEHEILLGLGQSQKQISPKFFYDETGSRLFDEICKQPEYYPTRTEIGIMDRHIDEIAELVGEQASIIEFGAGSAIKTRTLLANIDSIAAYVPVDISRNHLAQSAGRLAEDFPETEVLPVCADFTQPFDLPEPRVPPKRNIVFFPGSTIGNFSRSEALELMRVMRTEAGDNGALLIGVDLEKPKDILESAYNDAAGVTADFNLNLLQRLNREHEANFNVEEFQHHAVYDEQHSRIEMRLISLTKQEVKVSGEEFEFEKGEYIVTEHSHKYSVESFAEIAADAGFTQQAVWTDPDDLFSIQYLSAS